MPRRIQRFTAPAVAAGASSGPINISTFDDNRRRVLKGVYVSGGGALQHSDIDIAGRVYVRADHAMFGTGKGPIDLDQEYPAGTLFSVNFVVEAGGVAIAANAVSISLVYDSDPIIGPAAG